MNINVNDFMTFVQFIKRNYFVTTTNIALTSWSQDYNDKWNSF